MLSLCLMRKQIHVEKYAMIIDWDDRENDLEDGCCCCGSWFLKRSYSTTYGSKEIIWSITMFPYLQHQSSERLMGRWGTWFLLKGLISYLLHLWWFGYDMCSYLVIVLVVIDPSCFFFFFAKMFQTLDFALANLFSFIWYVQFSKKKKNQL